MTHEYIILKALEALKIDLFKLIKKGHFIPISDKTKSVNSVLAVRYITNRLFAFENACPYKIKYVSFESETQEGLAKGVGKTIEISESLSEITIFETIIHEWAHQILHLRLNAAKIEYVVQELEAESVSFIVGYVLRSIDEMSHSYINDKLEEFETNINKRLGLAMDIFQKSEKRIIRASETILKKLVIEVKQIEFIHN